MSSDKLAMMANQIATFFTSQPGADQAARVALHLNDFWAPEMRAELAALAEQKPGALHPLVTEALPQIKVPQPS